MKILKDLATKAQIYTEDTAVVSVNELKKCARESIEEIKNDLCKGSSPCDHCTGLFGTIE